MEKMKKAAGFMVGCVGLLNRVERMGKKSGLEFIEKMAKVTSEFRTLRA